MSDLILVLDEGTTSTRAMLFTPQGQPRGVAQRELTQHYSRPGWVEHDAAEIWQAVAAIVPRALQAAGVAASEILRILMNEGVMSTITAVMDPDMTELVAAELGINVEFKQAVSLEEQLMADLEPQEEDPANLVERGCGDDGRRTDGRGEV